MQAQQDTKDLKRIRDAIDAFRDEQRLQQDLDDYRRNVQVGRVEYDPEWVARLERWIADARRRQGCPADDPPEFPAVETPDLLTLF